MELICPICGEFLQKCEHSYTCPNRHSFDIARQGYVNLLPVQQKHSLTPGDTVRLTQDHYYVDTESAAYPVRPVTKFEKVEKPAAAPEVPAAVPATPIQPRVMPGRRAR